LGYLIAALVAPVAGPLLYGLLHDRPRAAHVLDRSVYVLVPLLVAWQILPDAWDRASIWPVVAVAAGVLVPTWIERVSHALRHRTDAAALVVGLSGLLLHTLLEGAALVPLESGTSGLAFALAVTLHRVVEGLVVWWLLRPRYGATAAVAGVALLLAATGVGFTLGLELLADVESAGVVLYQAFVAGSLVHVVFHQGRHDHTH
jgi:zinc transporter ZupT